MEQLAGAGTPVDFSLIALFARASLTVQIVMVILVLASVWAWAIIIRKIIIFNAARREAEEESGLKIGAVDFLCLAEEIIPADGQHWVSLIYITRDFMGEPRLTEPDKLSEIGWFALDDPPQPLSAFTAKAFRALNKAERRHGSGVGENRTL